MAATRSTTAHTTPFPKLRAAWSGFLEIFAGASASIRYAREAQWAVAALRRGTRPPRPETRRDLGARFPCLQGALTAAADTHSKRTIRDGARPVSPTLIAAGPRSRSVSDRGIEFRIRRIDLPSGVSGLLVPGNPRRGSPAPALSRKRGGAGSQGAVAVSMSKVSYARHRFPPVVIQHAFWL